MPVDYTNRPHPSWDETSLKMEFPIIILEGQTYAPKELFSPTDNFVLKPWLKEYVKIFVGIFFKYYSERFQMNPLDAVEGWTSKCLRWFRDCVVQFHWYLACNQVTSTVWLRQMIEVMR